MNATFGHATANTGFGISRARLARYAPTAIQLAVAGIFVMAGIGKLMMSAEDLTADSNLSAGFLRFIAVCELLGAGGLLLPGLLRLPRVLTPLAACGLVVIMIGAVTVTLMEGMYVAWLFPFTVGIAAAYIARVRRPRGGVGLRETAANA